MLEKQIADLERLYKVAIKHQMPVDELNKIIEERANLRRIQNIYKTIPIDVDRDSVQ